MLKRKGHKYKLQFLALQNDLRKLWTILNNFSILKYQANFLRCVLMKSIYEIYSCCHYIFYWCKYSQYCFIRNSNNFFVTLEEMSTQK